MLEQKRCVACLAGYILVASHNNKTRRTELTVYDLRNKFIAYFLRLPENQLIQHVVSVVAHAVGVSDHIRMLTELYLQEKDTKASSRCCTA